MKIVIYSQPGWQAGTINVTLDQINVYTTSACNGLGGIELHLISNDMKSARDPHLPDVLLSLADPESCSPAFMQIYVITNTAEYNCLTFKHGE